MAGRQGLPRAGGGETRRLPFKRGARPNDPHDRALSWRRRVHERELRSRALDQRLGDEQAETEAGSVALTAALAGAAGGHIGLADPQQHLSQLDGLAAAAAHELGTPLATIALVAKELDHAMPQDGPIAEDLKLLREQVERCRTILTKLTSMGEDQGAFLETIPLTQLVEGMVAPQRSLGFDIEVAAGGEGPEPVGRRNPGVMYGLANILDNAVDFAETVVRIEARWTRDEVRVEISDDGPGYAADVLLRVGEPYVTTRSAAERSEDSEEGGGLRLGLFIAKTLIERSGAQLLLSNAAPPATGAVARIVWPRQAFERGAASSPQGAYRTSNERKNRSYIRL